jgi:hypothetical protein
MVAVIAIELSACDSNVQSFMPRNDVKMTDAPTPKTSRLSSAIVGLAGMAIMVIAVSLQSHTAIPAWHSSSPLELCTDLVSFLCLVWATVRALLGISQGESRRAWIGIVAATAVFFAGQISDLLLNANAMIDEEWLDDQTGYKLAIAAVIFTGSFLSRRYLPSQRATKLWLTVAGISLVASALVASIDDIENYLFATRWSPMLKMAIWGTRTVPYFSETGIENIAELFELLALISIFASVILVDINQLGYAANHDPRHRLWQRSFTMAHYTLWRSRHPMARYSDYYVATVERKLRRRGYHAALAIEAGTGSASVQFRAKSQALADAVVAFMHRLGLAPHHSVVDYGCGSLRLGSLLIPQLQAGNYVGLDVTDRFYSAGLAALDSRLIAEKKPRLRTISPAILAELESAPPDFLLCFAVVQHVPTSELDELFRNILRLAGSKTTVLISFKSNVLQRKFRPASWSYSVEHLIESLHRVGLRRSVKVIPPSVVFGADARTSIWFMQIDPSRRKH